MAKVIMHIEDAPDGELNIHIDFEPAISKAQMTDKVPLTPAQAMGVWLLKELNDEHSRELAEKN